jgi:hypothetical protein
MQTAFGAPRERADPYIWVTWMTKLISGEAKCEWSLWFRARHQFDKMQDGFDLKRWTAEHDQLLAWRAGHLRDAGVTPIVEQDFTVQGRAATLSGKPDIKYRRDNVLWFEDCKTGQRRDSDHVQVLLYIWIAKFDSRLKNAAVRGRVVYADGLVDVDIDRLEQVKKDALRLIDIVGSPKPPARAPSGAECRFCSISDFYCEDRQHTPGRELYTTEDF